MNTIYLQIVLALLFFFSSCGTKETENKNSQPNVLFIIVDDLNDYQGWLGGHPQAKTPSVDRLATEGVRFANAHTNIGLCNPSRNSLFTGVYPHQSRNFGLDNITTQKLFKNNKTIMELFSENGYYVMGSGKLLHNNRLELWDEWGVQVNNYGPFAYNGADQVGHPSVPQPFRSIGDVDGSFAPLSDVPVFPKSQIKGDRPGWAYSGHEGRIFHYSNENDRDMLPDEMHAQWAANRIRQMDQEGIDQPFFMGVGFVRPHTPLYAPKRFFEMFPMEEIHLPLIKKGDVDDTHYKGNYPVERTEDDKWYTNTSKGQMYYKLLAESYEGREEEGLKHFIQAYLACVAFADEQVGIVLEALNNSSFKENTTIVLTSDHGWQMGTKEYLFKNSPWANSTHIPLVIKTPGGPRKQVDHPVSLIDIYPTLKDFCHLEGNNTRNESGFELGGVSLRKLIENPNADEWPGPAGTLTAIATDMVDYELNAQTFSYTTAKYRYIMYPNGQEEFYELGIDPHEWNNLASDSRFEATKNELRESIMELIRN